MLVPSGHFLLLAEKIFVSSTALRLLVLLDLLTTTAMCLAWQGSAHNANRDASKSLLEKDFIWAKTLPSKVAESWRLGKDYRSNYTALSHWPSANSGNSPYSNKRIIYGTARQWTASRS